MKISDIGHLNLECVRDWLVREQQLRKS